MNILTKNFGNYGCNYTKNTIGEKLIIEGGLNGHVGKNNNNYERVHGGFRYDVRKGGETVLDLATSYGLVLKTRASRRGMST